MQRRVAGASALLQRALMSDASDAQRVQDLEPDEYESTRAETLKQLEEFNASLSRMMARRARAECAALLRQGAAAHMC